jgi:hypothetical protein
MNDNGYHLLMSDQQKSSPSPAERNPYRSEDLFAAAYYLVRISLVLRGIRNRYSAPLCKDAPFLAIRFRAVMPFERMHTHQPPSALAQGSPFAITE